MILRKWLLVGGAIVFIVGGGTIFGLNASFGNHLQIATSSLPTIEQTDSDSQGIKVISQTDATTKQASEGCGTDTLDILVLGQDLPNTPNRGADAIRLVKVDFEKNEIVIVALPPDLQVSTPALADLNINSSTLTKVYLVGKTINNKTEQESMASGTKIIAQTLADNFGYIPSRYITVNESFFADTIDQVGGLKVNLPLDVDGTPENFGKFVAGEQTLTGQQVVN